MKRFFAVACSIAVGLIVADGGMADLGKGKSLTGMTVAQYLGERERPQSAREKEKRLHRPW